MHADIIFQWDFVPAQSAINTCFIDHSVTMLDGPAD